MQTALNFISKQRFDSGGKKVFGFRTTARDLEILQFILEMKFSTLEDIHAKFFRVTQSGEISTSDWWARERVTALFRAGFVHKFKTLSAKIFYVLTWDGYHFLKSHHPFKTFCRPLVDLDIRTLDHDLAVQKARLFLEEAGAVKSWISERALAERDEVKLYLPRDCRPDAIYVNRENLKVAFEFERTAKDRQRYVEKIKRYVQIIRSKEERAKVFDIAQFVCLKESIKRTLQNETRLYGDLFQIQTTEEFFKTHNLKTQGI